MIGADRAKKCKFMENKTGDLKKKRPYHIISASLTQHAKQEEQQCVRKKAE